jgi:hypothetical protein
VNYWIFIATAKPTDGLTARQVFEQRANDGFWGLGEKTPNRKSLQKGDRAVFYVGIPEKVFAGCATLESDSFELTDKERGELSHGISTFTTVYGVRLSDVQVWTNPQPVAELLSQLEFIENTEFWGAYFQGGVREIPEQDFNEILKARNPRSSVPTLAERDTANTHEFAMEAHLEEFLYKNWNSINWGASLQLYKTDELDGRQYPAGPWSIDFLAIDQADNSLVVIELKRGKTSDSTVGQLMRYMGWVRKNLAKPGENVKGLIVAHEVDQALGYATSGQPDIQVKTYEVSFRLSDFLM